MTRAYPQRALKVRDTWAVHQRHLTGSSVEVLLLEYHRNGWE